MPDMPPDFPVTNPLDSWFVWIFALCIGVVYAIRSYCSGPDCTSPKVLKGKVAIVTGISDGSLGEQVAIDLAQRKAKVIISGRSTNHAHLEAAIRKKSANEDVHFIPMDLLSFKSIKAFVAQFSSSNDRLDILVNCAGAMLPPFCLSAEGFECQFQINFLGQHLLTRSLLPLLRQTALASPEKETRVINVTCRAFALAEVLDLTSVRGAESVVEETSTRGAYYTGSKAAFTMASLELSRRLKDDGVTVNLVHPGVVKSNHGRHLPLFNNPIFKYTFFPFIWLMTKTPRSGAQTVVFCAVADACKGLTGKYFVDLYEQQIEGVVADRDAAAKLIDAADAWIAEGDKTE